MINGITSPFITANTTNGNKLFLHFDTGANGITLFNNAKKKLEQKVSSEKTITFYGVNKNKKEKVYLRRKIEKPGEAAYSIYTCRNITWIRFLISFR